MPFNPKRVEEIREMSEKAHEERDKAYQEMGEKLYEAFYAIPGPMLLNIVSGENRAIKTIQAFAAGVLSEKLRDLSEEIREREGG